jgi:hypothetical protein
MLLFSILIFLSHLVGMTQQRHYVLLQGVANKPFSVKLNNQNFSSSTSGQIIIPRLTEGTYQLTITPFNTVDSQIFYCTIINKDLGYRLINNDNKTWVLEDMFTKKQLKPGQKTIEHESAATSQLFTEMLMQVSDDSTLSQTVTDPPVVSKEPANTDTFRQAIMADLEIQEAIDSVSRVLEDADQHYSLSDSTQVTNNDSESSAGSIERMATGQVDKQFVSDSIEMVDGVTDTVVLHPKPVDSFLRSDSLTAEPANPFYTAPEKELLSDKIEKPTQTSSKISKEKTSDSVVSYQPVSNKDVSTIDALRPGCKTMLEESELEKVKRKVVSQQSIDAMVTVIKKAIYQKCITTQQVKTLSGLFLSDEGRYTLFDALYEQVYDYGLYPSLEKQIIDPYFKKRFQAMIH